MVYLYLEKNYYSCQINGVRVFIYFAWCIRAGIKYQINSNTSANTSAREIVAYLIMINDSTRDLIHVRISMVKLIVASR